MTNSSKHFLSTALLAAVTSVIFSGLFVWFAWTRYVRFAENPLPPAAQTPSSPVSVLDRDELVTKTVEAANPAVASVIVSKNLPVIERYYTNPLRGDDPFADFFGGTPFFNMQLPQYRQNGTQKQEVGGGTAFFVSKDGLLMTNKHVVDDPQAEYTVLLNDGKKIPAKVVAQDPGNDIALLKVDGSSYSPLSFAQTDAKLGQTVIAIGNALGEFRNTVSLGVVSGLSRSITAGNMMDAQTERIEQIIQTDAAINHGNSGGPLLNLQGEVIGMNTAIAESAQNIGFALPAKALQRALQTYQKNGKITQVFLGVRYMPITPDVQKKNNLKYDYGVLVIPGQDPTELAVVPGSPADKAGIVQNDIILMADGKKLDESTSLSSVIHGKNAGDSITLHIAHRGAEKDIKVTLEEQK